MPIRTVFCLITVFLFLKPSVAQETKLEHFHGIDNKIFLFSKKEYQTFDSIKTFVESNFEGNEDRVRAYFTWLALNINYDVNRMKELEMLSLYKVTGMDNFSQDADTVFKNRKAVCEGYCNLMRKFCNASGITCENVVGYSKNQEGKIDTKIFHVWNAVKIDSAFGLIDVTWSAGYMDPKEGYTKTFSDRYFLCKPRIFLKEHLPFNPMWQLMRHPVSKDQFINDTLNTKDTASFAYIDSIRYYLKLEPEEKEYYDFYKFYSYDSSNVMFAYNLDIFINNKIAAELVSAEMYYEDYVAFHNNTLNTKPTKANFKKARRHLISCENNHKNAEKWLARKRANLPDNKEKFDKINYALNEQKKIIKEQFAYLKKAEKQIKPK